MTTYQPTNPTDSPPPPTTTTGTVTIAPPDTAVKGGAVNTPAALNTAVQIVDTLYAGGQPVGTMMAGMAQENILPFTYFNGQTGGGGGWYPSSPSYQFNLSQGAINDQQMLIVPSISIPQADWDALPVGSTVCTFSQELQIQWTMTTTAGTNQTFTAPLNTLTGTWVKVSATQWQAQ